MSALRARLRPTTYFARRLFFQTGNKIKSIASSNFTAQQHRDVPRLNLHRSFSAVTEEKQTETLKGSSEKKEFQAETRMLLDIVARSLYSDKEVFIRELISNASDALEKFRYLSVSGAPDAPKLDEVDRPLEIRLTTNKQNRTITFQDTGIGMTKEELTENLGTIARSGSKSFIEEIKKQGGEQASSIIGQFGVGFYSAFMVADTIEVYTRSSIAGSSGYKWMSDGSGVYEIQEAEGVPVGTKIVIHLKTDCREYSDDNTVQGIIMKYSNFIGSPIYLNDDQVNSIKPLWLMEPKEVSPEEHIEFYKFISNSFDKPRFTLQYRVDAPLCIRALLYVPAGKPGLFEMSRDSDVGVALYSRKILIKNKADNLLPKWLRFVKGVVDSEDIPLNLSRELLQNSALIAKLRSVLTNRFLKFMVDMSKKEPVDYDAFYKEYSLFLKEGIVTSQNPLEKEEIAKLLRFESSILESGQKTSLADYIARQKDDQKIIYYLAAPSRELAETSPYYESLKKRGLEVLFCYEMYDELVLLELKQFGGRPLTSVEDEMQEDAADAADAIIGSDGLSESELGALESFVRGALGARVAAVRGSRRLRAHACAVRVREMAAARHFVRTQAHALSDDNRYALLRPQLDLNPRHPLIEKLHKLVSTDEELARMVTHQLFTNAMVTAGLIMDPRNLTTGIDDLLVKALEKH